MKRLAVVTVFIVLCGIAGTSARYDGTATPAQPYRATTAHFGGTAASGLTAEQCLYFQQDGAVDVCHATRSRSNPYVLLRMSAEACISGHSGHPNDVIAGDHADCPH